MASEFAPHYTPPEMWALGVFDQDYFGQRELPECLRTVVAPDRNLFAPRCGQTRNEWLANGWIHPDDPLGWFQWYCRWYEGRRHEDDARQIARWRSYGARHGGALLRQGRGDPSRSLRRRQGLLHWAHDPYTDCR